MAAFLFKIPYTRKVFLAMMLLSPAWGMENTQDHTHPTEYMERAGPVPLKGYPLIDLKQKVIEFVLNETSYAQFLTTTPEMRGVCITSIIEYFHRTKWDEKDFLLSNTVYGGSLRGNEVPLSEMIYGEGSKEIPLLLWTNSDDKRRAIQFTIIDTAILNRPKYAGLQFHPINIRLGEGDFSVKRLKELLTQRESLENSLLSMVIAKGWDTQKKEMRAFLQQKNHTKKVASDITEALFEQKILWQEQKVLRRQKEIVAEHTNALIAVKKEKETKASLPQEEHPLNQVVESNGAKVKRIAKELEAINKEVDKASCLVACLQKKRDIDAQLEHYKAQSIAIMHAQAKKRLATMEIGHKNIKFLGPRPFGDHVVLTFAVPIPPYRERAWSKEEIYQHIQAYLPQERDMPIEDNLEIAVALLYKKIEAFIKEIYKEERRRIKERALALHRKSTMLAQDTDSLSFPHTIDADILQEIASMESLWNKLQTQWLYESIAIEEFLGKAMQDKPYPPMLNLVQTMRVLLTTKVVHPFVDSIAIKGELSQKMRDSMRIALENGGKIYKGFDTRNLSEKFQMIWEPTGKGAKDTCTILAEMLLQNVEAVLQQAREDIEIYDAINSRSIGAFRGTFYGLTLRDDLTPLQKQTIQGFFTQGTGYGYYFSNVIKRLGSACDLWNLIKKELELYCGVLQKGEVPSELYKDFQTVIARCLYGLDSIDTKLSLPSHRKYKANLKNNHHVDFGPLPCTIEGAKSNNQHSLIALVSRMLKAQLTDHLGSLPPDIEEGLLQTFNALTQQRIAFQAKSTALRKILDKIQRALTQAPSCFNDFYTIIAKDFNLDSLRRTGWKKHAEKSARLLDQILEHAQVFLLYNGPLSPSLKVPPLVDTRSAILEKTRGEVLEKGIEYAPTLETIAGDIQPLDQGKLVQLIEKFSEKAGITIDETRELIELAEEDICDLGLFQDLEEAWARSVPAGQET